MTTCPTCQKVADNATIVRDWICTNKWDTPIIWTCSWSCLAVIAVNKIMPTTVEEIPTKGTDKALEA